MTYRQLFPQPSRPPCLPAVAEWRAVRAWVADSRVASRGRHTAQSSTWVIFHVNPGDICSNPRVTNRAGTQADLSLFLLRYATNAKIPFIRVPGTGFGGRQTASPAPVCGSGRPPSSETQRLQGTVGSLSSSACLPADSTFQPRGTGPGKGLSD